jgi:hypothetical protein
VVLDGFKSRGKFTVSAEFSTTFSWDKYGDFLKGGNDFLLSVWFEEKDTRFCHSSSIWIMRLPVPRNQMPPELDSVHYSHFQALASQCTRHSECCRDTSVSAIDKSPILKLIDCEQRKLVTASGNKAYVTLSYVWGAEPMSDFSTERLHSLPQTIEDAIVVTLAMSYRYLWVDKYCIDQANEEEASAQIAMMDLIYHQSDMTIIAACGKILAMDCLV